MTIDAWVLVGCSIHYMGSKYVLSGTFACAECTLEPFTPPLRVAKPLLPADLVISGERKEIGPVARYGEGRGSNGSWFERDVAERH